MAEPVKKDDALAQAVREAFRRHMENARATAASDREAVSASKTAPRLIPAAPANDGAPLQISSRPQPLSDPPPPDANDSKKTDNRPTATARANGTGTGSNDARRPSSRIADHETAPSRNLRPRGAPPPRSRSRADLIERFEAELFGEDESLPAGDSPPARSRQKLVPPSAANDRSESIAREREPARQPHRDDESDQPELSSTRSRRDARQADDRHSARGARSRAPRFEDDLDDDTRPGARSARRLPTYRPGLQKKGQAGIIMAATIAVVALCLGAVIYLWTLFPPPASISNSTQPVANTASIQNAANTSPIRAVRTSAINLDEVDLAVQDSRERIGVGDIAGARKALEPFRRGNDARALVALAETYDPTVIRDPNLASIGEAQSLYEAAGRAGFAGAEARISRLLVQTNSRPSAGTN